MNKRCHPVDGVILPVWFREDRAVSDKQAKDAGDSYSYRISVDLNAKKERLSLKRILFHFSAL